MTAAIRLQHHTAAARAQPRSIEALEMRAATESARPAVRTTTGIVIGASYQRHHGPYYAQAASGPHRRTNTLGDRAVAWASAAGLVFVIVLLAVERLA